MSDADWTGKGYRAFQNAEWFCIVGFGSVACRFGPFTGARTGEIMTQCVEEQIPLTIVANCGDDFDWDLARDTRGDLTKMNFIQRWRWKRRARKVKIIADESRAKKECNQQPQLSDHQS